MTLKAGESDKLNVLGMPLWFLCDAKDTAGAWSLMEEDIPAGHGPPTHRHDWDEAYYVTERALIFAVPAHSSEFFKEVNREVHRIPEDLAKVPAIGGRHGIEFLPARAPAT